MKWFHANGENMKTCLETKLEESYHYPSHSNIDTMDRNLSQITRYCQILAQIVAKSMKQ